MKLPVDKVKLIQLIFGLVISGLCLWLALRNVSFNRLVQALSMADYLWVVLAILVQLLAVLTRAQRWRVLLASQVSLNVSVWALGIGYLFTNVFPFRLGEPARVAAMSARSRLPLAQVAATAVLERLFDVATIVLVLAGVLPFMDVPFEVKQAGLLFGLIVVVGLGFIIGLVSLGEQAETLVKNWSQRLLPRYVEAVTARFRELIRGFAGLTSGAVAGRMIFWSLATWACSIGVYWCVLFAFQPLARLVEAAFIVAALSLAVAVPAGPGFIGVFQWVGKQALVLPFGSKYDAASALAIILTAHLVYYLFTTALGIIGLWKFGQSFTHLRRVVGVGHVASSQRSFALGGQPSGKTDRPL